MKLTYFLIALALLLSPVLTFAAYNDVSLTTGTTLRVTVGGTVLDLTVTSGTVESMTVMDSSLSIGLAGGSSIDLTSADKITFGYTKTNTIAGFACNSASSVLNLSLASGQTAETVFVTPNTTTCAASTSGGGGSSTVTTATPTTTTTTSTTSSTSSSSASPTTTTTTTATTPTTTTTTTTAPKPATPAVTAPAPVVSVPASVVSMSPVLMKELNPGARNNEVMDLQKLLARDPEIYPDGTVSGFYGPKTVAAVRKFQAKYGLPVVGRVGPATLAKINEVLSSKPAEIAQPSVQDQTTDQITSQIQAIQSQIQALTSGSAVAVSSVVGVSVNSELNPGARNDEVMDLQKLLARDPEIYPEGTVSGFYGPKTTAAVRKFQTKYGINPVGRVGPATMAKINEVLGGESIVVPVTPLPVAPATESSQTQQIENQIKAIQDQINSLTAPVAPIPAPIQTTSNDALTKQIEDQMKAIQAQIDALLKQ
ncbi:MAG: peptidoglycan-binding protein [bacterium]|nr:peptidoglycan-binding protein [bacterium]